MHYSFLKGRRGGVSVLSFDCAGASGAAARVAASLAEDKRSWRVPLPWFESGQHRVSLFMDGAQVCHAPTPYYLLNRRSRQIGALNCYMGAALQPCRAGCDDLKHERILQHSDRRNVSCRSALGLWQSVRGRMLCLWQPATLRGRACHAALLGSALSSSSRWLPPLMPQQPTLSCGSKIWNNVGFWQTMALDAH